MQVVLRSASRAQEIEARKQRSVEWARWLGLDGYLRKEERLEKLEHANKGKLVTWVLVSAEDPESLDILSTCTTYRRDILTLPPNETKAISGTGYAIASVFTPSQFRGKGYATRMMGLLHFAIAHPSGVPSFPASWGELPKQIDIPGVVSVLYSGVGAFYSGCPPGEGTGWEIVGTKTTHWLVDKLECPTISVEVETLSQDEAISVAANDACLFKRDFESNGPSPRMYFGFRPTAAWCSFQMRNHMDHPDYAESPPKIWGARLQSENGETHFIVWTYKPYPELHRKLIVVNLRVSLITFPPLFAAMISIARKERHQLIEAWNLDDALDSVVQESGGRTAEREGQLPAMKWYGPGQDVVWVGNNK
ncbi:protein phosphatase 2 (formerly 2A), catalytic subunit [Ceratobasidium sp. AG-Ba]|nr:protein phosphatase 2 (formerly 2A), catalytic subunit [Ceratobasidium sp. AG-Ba]QRW04201.1 protein phosphatase 2 (formerly 2A), catalytic subunit [Ceratobasidium sp. AG-Ba]